MKDLMHLIFFEKLLQEADNELVEKAKAEEQLALGYTCYFVPEALLNLPGCFYSRWPTPTALISPTPLYARPLTTTMRYPAS